MVNNHIPLDPTVAPPAFTGANATDVGGNASYAFGYDENRASGALLGTVAASGAATTVIEVKLNERDVDDTAPAITGPSNGAGAAASALSVNENQTAVTTLTASETVTWSIAGGEDGAKFAIDPSTGVLTFVAAPDYEAPTDANRDNLYLVEVQARDAAGNQSRQSANLNIARQMNRCTQRNRVYLDGAVAFSNYRGQWMARGAVRGLWQDLV